MQGEVLLDPGVQEVHEVPSRGTNRRVLVAPQDHVPRVAWPVQADRHDRGQRARIDRKGGTHLPAAPAMDRSSRAGPRHVVHTCGPACGARTERTVFSVRHRQARPPDPLQLNLLSGTSGRRPGPDSAECRQAPCQDPPTAASSFQRRPRGDGARTCRLPGSPGLSGES